jgi:predicted ATPase
MTMPQIVSPSVPSDPTTITERYDALVGTIERDPAQEEVVAVLDALARRLRDIKLTCFGLTQLLDRGDTSDEKRRGIYIFGGVGRGKTMLMDFFLRVSHWKPSAGYIFTSLWRMCTNVSGKLARRWKMAVRAVVIRFHMWFERSQMKQDFFASMSLPSQISQTP